jgi:hypothetical protein
MVAGGILAAMQIRSGWLILAFLSFVFSAARLPAVLPWVGRVLQRRRREAKGALKKGGEKVAVGGAPWVSGREGEGHKLMLEVNCKPPFQLDCRSRE